MKLKVCASVVVLILLTSSTADCHHNFIDKFKWRDVEFVWPSDDVRQEALLNGKYVPSNNLPLAFDVWRDKIFLTVPRCVHEENFHCYL